MNNLYEMIERLEYYRGLLEIQKTHDRQKELVLLISITKDDIIREQSRLMQLTSNLRKAS